MNFFSFRAELPQDVTTFLLAANKADLKVDITLMQPMRLKTSTGTIMESPCDVEAEFVSQTATLEKLREVLRGIPDNHIMLETLRPVRLADNHLGRDSTTK